MCICCSVKNQRRTFLKEKRHWRTMHKLAILAIVGIALIVMVSVTGCVQQAPAPSNQAKQVSNLTNLVNRSNLRAKVGNLTSKLGNLTVKLNAT